MTNDIETARRQYAQLADIMYPDGWHADEVITETIINFCDAEHHRTLRAYIAGTLRRILARSGAQLQPADIDDLVSETVCRTLQQMQLHEWRKNKALVSRIARFALADHWRAIAKQPDPEQVAKQLANEDPELQDVDDADEHESRDDHWREFQKRIAEYSDKTGIPAAAIAGLLACQTDAEIAERCEVKARTVQSWRLRIGIKR